jgi:hypothetical protein
VRPDVDSRSISQSTMSDLLSTTANVLAVVGLADVVFQRGRQLYELCSRYRDASSAISALLSELSTSTSIIAHARIFLDEYEQSSSTGRDGEAITQIRTILTLMRHEFDLLAKIISDAQAAQASGWLASFTRTLRFAMEDQRILFSSQRLQRLTLSMVAAFSVTGAYVPHLLVHSYPKC